MLIKEFLAIALGATVGAWLRWGLGIWLNPLHHGFPLGTLAANLLGGWLMGLALGLVQSMPELPAHVKLLIMTGFLGGLTTFSTFSAEVFGLLQRGAVGWALAATSVHVAGSVLLTWVGYVMFGWLKH